MAGRVFSFPGFLGALLVAAVVLNLSLRLNYVEHLPAGHWHPAFVEGDTYWHIAVGERILKSHHWPTTNYYSFTTPDSPWMAYEWLGEVVMALAARLGTPRALMALLTLLVSAIVLLVYALANLAGGNPKSAFAATALMFPLLGSCFSLRPQLLGYIFLLITFVWLERFRQGRQSQLWALPLVFALWVNTHGTFALGLAVVGIYLLAGVKRLRLGLLEGKAWQPRQFRHLGGIFLLCMAALLVNPYGPRLLAYERGIRAQTVNLTYFEEWQPLAIKEFFGVWFLVLLLGYGAGVAILRRPQLAHTLALIVLAASLAWRHQRFIVFFAIVLAPALADILAQVFPAYEPDKNHPGLNVLLSITLAVLAFSVYPSLPQLQKVIGQNQPVRAVDYLRTRTVAQPMLNDNFWGGYLIWAFKGRRKIFIDGRSDAYEPSGMLADYIKIMRAGDESMPLLKKYGVRSCLIEQDGELAALLDRQPDWKRVYQDDLSVIFEFENLGKAQGGL